MRLEQRCYFAFDHLARSRGESTAPDVEIVVVDVDNQTIEADLYKHCIVVEWSCGATDHIHASCTCSHYLCSHVWSVLLAMDREDLSRMIPGYGALDVVADGRLPRQPSRRNETRLAAVEPDWKAVITEAATTVSQRVVNTSVLDETVLSKRLWYTLDEHQLGCVIHLGVQEPTQSGQYGKIKRHYVRSYELVNPASAELRLLKMLVENRVDKSPADYYSSVSQCEIGADLVGTLLPKLAATGRLTLGGDKEFQQDRVLTWDDCRWSMKLSIDDSQGDCRVVATLIRDEHTRYQVDGETRCLGGGVVRHKLQLFELEDQAWEAWLNALLETPIIAAKEDQAALYSALRTAPAAPPVEQPEDLHFSTITVDPVPRLCVKTPPMAHSKTLFASLHFDYDDVLVPADSTGQAVAKIDQQLIVERNIEKERDHAAALQEFEVTAVDPYFSRIVGSAQFQFQKRLLPQIVDALSLKGWVIEADGARLRQASNFSFNVTSGVDWFDLEANVDYDGTQLGLPTLLDALQSGKKTVRLDDGSEGIIPADWLKRFASVVSLAEVNEGKVRFKNSQALLLDALLAEHESNQASLDQKFTEFRQKLQSFEGVSAATEPKSFQGELRPYQREGLGWLQFLTEFGFGGCLADDMGLGKTIQVLAFFEKLRNRRMAKSKRQPSIAVVPKSLVFNWIEEAKKFTPKLKILNYTGLDRHASFNAVADHHLVLTTYGTLRNDIVKLKEVAFEYAVLDESQAIKNAESQAAKACRLLNAKHRLAMTGTPIENHLGELWSMFEFLNPGLLGRSKAFGSLAKRATAENGAIPMLAKAVSPYILRRTKQEVLKDLPTKTEQTLYCDLSPKERKSYDELREYYRTSLQSTIAKKGLAKSKIHVLEALLRLRQAACHRALVDPNHKGLSSAKLDFLWEQLSEIIDEGHKALVFSQFTSLLAIVRRMLERKKVTYEYLDGKTSKRQQKVERFQSDDKCPVFLISLKAGGYGLNLTEADYVYILDPWWNPAVEAQAIDRTHRIGQTKNVFAYRLIARDTVEEKILKLQAGKRELADAIVSENSSLIRELTKDDLQLLLS